MRRLTPSSSPTVTIIGGGVIGCAIASTLSLTHQNIVLLERHPALGDEQSGRNSGVVHAGIYYPPGSLKAKWCVEGNALLSQFCRKHDVPFLRTGKIIVATTREEDERLETYRVRAIENGVPGIQKLLAWEARELEPKIHARAALFSPTTGVLDAPKLVQTLARLAKQHGTSILLETEVVSIDPGPPGFELQIQHRDGKIEGFETVILINAAGLYADEIARMVNPESGHTIVPIRGEYARFDRTKRPELALSGLCVYPTPVEIERDGEVGTIPGIHLTPTLETTSTGEVTVGRTVLVGPTTTPVHEKSDLESDRHPVEYFHEQIHPFFPSLRSSDLELDFAGIRATLPTHDDFLVERDTQHPNGIHLLGINSPGLTACLPIANHVATLVRETFLP